MLGAALAAAGHHVVAAAGRLRRLPGPRRPRCCRGAAILPADEVARAATDLLLLAVPDDALAGVVAGLAGTGALRPGQVVAHTSGAHGLAVLAGRDAGARPLALHPAMTFTGTAADLDRLPGIAWGVTAPADLRPFADAAGRRPRRRARSGSPRTPAPLYHAALAHGANHLVTLVNEAAGPAARRRASSSPEKVLAPLLHAALDNALRLGDAALTGPVSRGDAGTVAAHLDRARGDRAGVRTARIWPWPGAPRTGPSPPAGCGRRTPSALLGRAGQADASAEPASA